MEFRRCAKTKQFFSFLSQAFVTDYLCGTASELNTMQDLEYLNRAFIYN